MKINFKIDNKNYFADLSKEISIAITLLPNDKQPNHFGAPACTSKPLEMGSYIGDTKRGGSCNANVLTMIPHCNGTHTESVSHIINEMIPVYQCIKQSAFPCVLISVEPTSPSKTSDAYQPCMDTSNKVIARNQLEKHLEKYSNSQLQGLIIRTLENSTEKKSLAYNSDHYPPYLTNDAMQYLVEREVHHLLVDFPSVDKMYDEGQLSNHRLFWKVNKSETKLNPSSTIDKTITEMVFVSDDVKDGFYLCNLQVPEIATDAVPSRPILYPMQITER
ncbi:MAG: cyclase family protein [Kangiellaceae bacterium]